MDPPANELPPAKRSRKRSWLKWLLVAALPLLITAELGTRFILGLGDPPLVMADPDIEYLFRPNQEVRRLHHRIHYNAWSMRSDDFPRSRGEPNELRIMVLGDSVINGGAQTDQSELATSIIQQRLRERLARPVVVGNVSAASWGPPNLQAYVKKFGLFDADIVVIVVSSHDYADAPTFENVVGVQESMPDTKPLLALQELVTRYILPRLRSNPGDASVPSTAAPEQTRIDGCLNALKELIAMSRTAGADVLVVQYPEQVEVKGQALPGHELIRTLATDAGATVIQIGPAFASAAAAGTNVFRDNIHPTADGQRVMADVLFDAIMKQLDSASPRR